MKKTIILLLITLFFCQNVFALYGTRPMGMGSAFTAVADDANAPYWNPAGLALNPEVSITGSTKLNNRNTWVGDNLLSLKMCYETKLNPFQWLLGIGIASLVAYEGASYLGEKGILKTGWGRNVQKTKRGESMAEQVTEVGSEQAVSLRQIGMGAIKDALGVSSGGAKETPAVQPAPPVRPVVIRPRYYVYPAHSWYHPRPNRRDYWEPVEYEEVAEEINPTKAQFALGLGWINDNNIPLDEKSNQFTIGVASGFEERVAIGANVNLYDKTIISSNVRGFGGDIDLGFIGKPVEYISFGLATKGILTSDIYWQNGARTRYEMLVNAGLAVKPLPFFTVAADAHNIFNQNSQQATMHYGAEVSLIPGLLLRGGLDDGNKTAGLTLVFGNLLIDYAILGGTYNRTQMIGGSWRF
ncbi:hypothetical protein A3K48_02915 [candidate division WOR-1 bacterium RIFOXYA12_FULL_52_29]|uniref:PorV/PorQ family protein n=1 Tax=candidate division WOR-1 bacterium RIFOXYC12_FULL_54_18 TaxID=1802584 RepID=A0A1F4T5T9_UNCSA|nr:MAG: hypothetical protein A3K44_02915 [candidate division WOR-1 bacterium RIFOXYA2_FULL_51_19]OGC17519.1 MAG: hypothetical protein A3K48_02915 [candidate division WOR-1 bacterium RIFOXYA12_FULL_52_29]OGC26376.1 MAG: hypothetical protein A3K32_02910 [candidate division WOR-1 bacterium RIFOXYB2_FULL_45_9]OGC27936.1 MAG: hypothetical protein A3K49_02915 [candidate division WOR-1 bacterium RIFOXYC12_FULL_54_18]OGC29777.1 MAG: hypothetical protein A2346_03420 [candidate division WOR-1 bacterium R